MLLAIAHRVEHQAGLGIHRERWMAAWGQGGGIAISVRSLGQQLPCALCQVADHAPGKIHRPFAVLVDHPAAAIPIRQAILDQLNTHRTPGSDVGYALDREARGGHIPGGQGAQVFVDPVDVGVGIG